LVTSAVSAMPLAVVKVFTARLFRSGSTHDNEDSYFPHDLIASPPAPNFVFSPSKPAYDNNSITREPARYGTGLVEADSLHWKRIVWPDKKSGERRDVITDATANIAALFIAAALTTKWFIPLFEPPSLCLTATDRDPRSTWP
jgi:hypothetical protein